jgi:hypothetical protein
MALASPAPETTLDTDRSAAWDSLTRWIKLYSWAQVAFLASLVGITHFFPLIGKSWSPCLVHGTGATDWACVAFFHVYEIPLVVLFAYHACVGFAQVTRAHLGYYVFLTLFQIVMLFVFVTFESRVVLDDLAHQAPTWEIVVLFGACVGMIVDVMLGSYVVFARLLPAYLTSSRDRQS